MVCGHGGNDFVSESMNKSKQKSCEDDALPAPSLCVHILRWHSL